MTTESPILVATDLKDASRPALLRGQIHAAATGAPLIVCHVVLDVFRNHPLIPDPRQNELMLGANLIGRAVERVNEQVAQVLGLAPGQYAVEVETGSPDEEIVRIAERRRASLIVVGATAPEDARRPLGHVAERVVRYAEAPVLVARAGEANGRIVVATDFTEGSHPAVEVAAALARSRDADVTLVHVLRPTSSALASALMPLGDTWTPPPKSAMDELRALGASTLAGLARSHGFAKWEQLEGEPAESIVARAAALDAEMIVMGSRGRRGLARLVLGSVAEDVIGSARCSVLVARSPGGP